jgi:hypothetical protein
MRVLAVRTFRTRSRLTSLSVAHREGSCPRFAAGLASRWATESEVSLVDQHFPARLAQCFQAPDQFLRSLHHRLVASE